MPIRNEHIRKASENEAFAKALEQASGTHRDWVVTGLFYAALHHVSAVLHDCGCSDADLRPHSRRDAQLARRLPALYGDYKQLKDDSEDARYECRAFTDAEVASLRNTEFARLKAEVQRLLP